MKLSAQANRLVLLAVAGQAIAYGLQIFVARRLTISGFEAYVVASAIFIVLAAVAPLGVEKYTLRKLPALIEAADWSRASGLIRFGLRRTAVSALVAGSLVAGWAAWRGGGETQRAILVTCLSLPAGALVHYGLDLLTAAGRPFRALAIFRIFVPGMALALLVCASALGAAMTGPLAVAGWGAAWLVALALMTVGLRETIDARVVAAAPQSDAREWRPAARPFMVYRAALVLLGQAGVLALELLGPGASDVGAYAAAMATVSMAAVLATATNRAYGRDLSILLAQGDLAGVRTLKRERLIWLAPGIGVFLFVALVFPQALLGLFRPEFGIEGALPLRLLAVTTAVTVAGALSPTWLKFRDRRRLLYAITAAAAAAQVIMLAVLVPLYGATGAALAYAVSMTGLYAACTVAAQRDISRPG